MDGGTAGLRTFIQQLSRPPRIYFEDGVLMTRPSPLQRIMQLREGMLVDACATYLASTISCKSFSTSWTVFPGLEIANSKRPGISLNCLTRMSCMNIKTSILHLTSCSMVFFRFLRGISVKSVSFPLDALRYMISKTLKQGLGASSFPDLMASWKRWHCQPPNALRIST